MMALFRSLWEKFSALRFYTLIAGGGFLIDLSFFLLLVHTHLAMPFWASIAGILSGASFVYVFATRRVFISGGGFRWDKWGFYIAYVVATMFIWSGVIASLVAFGLWPVIAKFAILPVTFYTNFLFMGWLIEGRIRWH